MIVREKILDERGRFITPEELRWIRNKIKDPYDPRFLTLCINVTTGARTGRSRFLRLSDFTQGFAWIKTWQNKPYVRKKDGQVRIKSKPLYKPLPPWLQVWLSHYVQYRLMLGQYVNENLTDFRLFPTLYKNSLCSMFKKFRIRHSEEAPWLNDIWKVIEYYTDEGELIKVKKLYRLAPHAGKAFYATSAYDIVGNDPVKGAAVTGHDRMKDFIKYAKPKNVHQAKMEIMEKIMTPLMSDNSIPILRGQKRLDSY